MKIDFSNAWTSGDRIVNSVITKLPNLAMAVVIFIIFVILAKGAKSMVR